jgi:uncharacterized membrane-anchored protein
MRKVPEITLIFWITKLLTTAMGESTSDFLVSRINPYLAVMLGGIGLIISLLLQFMSKKYKPWIYWLNVVMVAIFGTMAADALHKQIGVSYLSSTIFFSLALIAVFWIWSKTEKTLSIHSINSFRREIFYWLAVITTFALGTAAGDLTASTLGLGYFSSIILFSGILLIPVIGFYRFKLNSVLAFWFAYILTRPIGASLVDWIAKPKNIGGLNLGDIYVSLSLALLILLAVLFMTLDKTEFNKEHTKFKEKS